MKFQNTVISKASRYSLGIEEESGLHFAAIPVANRMVDYIESTRSVMTNMRPS